ncbi:hypothetical protein [Sideroxyarcus sp. TK5]
MPTSAPDIPPHYSKAWINSRATSGTTESERYLGRLAQKAFLSLWSYSNVYTDEGRKGTGNGKEFCDLLVVFGNDVILFSDKHCEFKPHADINVAWSRWYKRAIEKSAKQLSGAEAWLKRFPDKLFLDPSCTTKLPIQLPDPSKQRIHLIAVARGASEHATAYWGGGSSGSLFIDTELVQRDHYSAPFRIGWTLPSRRIVHVFDETTLDIVLQELDTISDFVNYLTKKQEVFSTSGVDLIVPGEEELLATYLTRYDPVSNQHHFPEAPPGSLIALREGGWTKLVSSKEYRKRIKENEISYLWDNLIEFQNEHIISGTASTIFGDESIEMYERIMRAMAQEDRITRRTLGESFHRANEVNIEGKRFTRTIFRSPENDLAYVLMSLPRPPEYTDKQYKEQKWNDLIAYSYRCKLKFDSVREVIGIAIEPGNTKLTSVEYLLIDFGKAPLPSEYSEQIRDKLIADNMWESKEAKCLLIPHRPF